MPSLGQKKKKIGQVVLGAPKTISEFFIWAPEEPFLYPVLPIFRYQKIDEDENDVDDVDDEDTLLTEP